MSLGYWFRDYVYIPLGGNRRGLPRQLFNIAVVWALTGIWHGASWTYMLWGLYFAIFLTMEKMFLLSALEKAPSFVGRVYTLLVVFFSWALFQLNSVPDALVYIRAMLGFGGAGFASGADLYYLSGYALMFIIGVVGCTDLGAKTFRKLPEKFTGAAVPILIVIGMLLITAHMVDASYSPFLYFKF